MSTKLPPGATETTLDFADPGKIAIKVTPSGFEQILDLEDLFQRLQLDAYNEEIYREWERVFRRMADALRRKLPPPSYPPVHMASGHAPGCGLWWGRSCSCQGRRV